MCTHLYYSRDSVGSCDLFVFSHRQQSPGSFFSVFQGSGAYGWMNKIKESHLQAIRGTCGYWTRRVKFLLRKTHTQEARWTAVSLPRDTEHLERVTREWGLFKYGNMQIALESFPFLLRWPGLLRSFSSPLKGWVISAALKLYLFCLPHFQRAWLINPQARFP